MTHILHIDFSPRGVSEASAKHSCSTSRILSKEFISGWKDAHPNYTATYRDLGHYPVPFVSEDWMSGDRQRTGYSKRGDRSLNKPLNARANSDFFIHVVR
jgi:FMN-dependent NADH-azoreductase